MLAFLRGMESTELPALANIGIIDDGSEVTPAGAWSRDVDAPEDL